jgi:hypothetical protein
MTVAYLDASGVAHTLTKIADKSATTAGKTLSGDSNTGWVLPSNHTWAAYTLDGTEKFWLKITVSAALTDDLLITRVYTAGEWHGSVANGTTRSLTTAALGNCNSTVYDLAAHYNATMASCGFSWNCGTEWASLETVASNCPTGVVTSTSNQVMNLTNTTAIVSNKTLRVYEYNFSIKQ